MNIEAIAPVNVVADQPGQVKSRQIIVSNVEQASPTSSEFTVTVSAAGNVPVSTPVVVNFDPEDVTPEASVDVPAGAGVEVTIGPFATATQNGQPIYTAELTITTV